MEKDVADPGTRGGLWARLRSCPGTSLVVGVIAVNFVLGLLTNQLLFRDFANSGDEYSYQISSWLFAEGKLSVPSPEPRDFFEFNHVVNDGRFYGKYPPGWPALLTPGVLLGVPWIVNLILSAATLAACYAVAKRHFSDEVAAIAMLIALGNPFIVFNSASYFSHTACLLFVTLFLGGALDWLRDPSSKRAPLLMGACAGAAFLIRPYSAVVLMGTAGAVLAARSVKAGTVKSLGPCLVAFAIPALGFLALHFLYNRFLTGSALQLPFTKYDTSDKPSWPTLAELPHRLKIHGALRLLQLSVWLPLAPVLAILYALMPRIRSRFPGALLALFPAGLFAAYFLYRGTGTNQYGPRYLFEGVTALLILAACVIQGFPRRRAVLLSAVVLVNAAAFVGYGHYHVQQIRDRMLPYDLVERQGVRNAIVFLRTGSGTMEDEDLTRNGIHFNGPVLYVVDKGPRNEDLRKRYPDRQAFYFEYNESTRTGRLTPWPSRG